MKQCTLMAILILIAMKSFSQDLKFSLELNYPIPMDNNFIGKNYGGRIDIGTDYRIANLKPINIGFSLNGGILVNNTNINHGLRDFKITSYLMQPRIFGELNLKSIKKLHQIIGLGYAIMVFKGSGINNGFDVSESRFTEGGLNLNFGLAYDITEKLLVKAQYDYIYLNPNRSVLNVKFNRNVNILKIGFGYRL